MQKTVRKKEINKDRFEFFFCFIFRIFQKEQPNLQGLTFGRIYNVDTTGKYVRCVFQNMHVMDEPKSYSTKPVEISFTPTPKTIEKDDTVAALLKDVEMPQRKLRQKPRVTFTPRETCKSLKITAGDLLNPRIPISANIDFDEYFIQRPKTEIMAIFRTLGCDLAEMETKFKNYSNLSVVEAKKLLEM